MISLLICLFVTSLRICEGNLITLSDNVSIIDSLLIVDDLPLHKIVPKINDIDMGITNIEYLHEILCEINYVS